MVALNFDVAWRDRGVSRGLQGIGKDADRAQASFSRFKPIAAAALAAAGIAAVKFGADSVRAYTDAQKSQAKLEFAFQKFPRLADTNKASLDRLNQSLAQKTRFDDDATASGQAVLAQFNLTGQQITQLTPLLQDYAAKTGKDLPAAATALGRSFMGNTRALKEVGINYKSTGDRAKDFTNITGLLRQQVGGFAEREGATAAGKLAILQNQFGELQEEAGQKLLPALIGVTDGLLRLVGFVDRNQKVIVPLAAAVGTLAGGIWVAHKATQAFAVVQGLAAGAAAKGAAGLALLRGGYQGTAVAATVAGRAMKVATLAIPGVGIALFAVTTALQHFASQSDAGEQTASEFASAMQSIKGNVDRATAALNENVRAVAVQALQSRGAFDQARMLGLSYATVTDAALGNKAAISQVNQVLRVSGNLNPQVSKSNSDLRNASLGLSRSLGVVATESIEATEAERVRRSAMQSSSGATRIATSLTDQLAEANGQLRTATRQMNAELQRSIDKFSILKDGALSVERANSAWQESLDEVRGSTRENGRSLDQHTEKGRANRRAVVNMITSLNDKVTADVKSASATRRGESATERYNRIIRTARSSTEAGRESLIRAARAAGLNEGEVRKLLNRYSKTPKQVSTDIRTPGMVAAQNNVKKLDDRVNGLNNKAINVRVNYGATGGIRLGSDGKPGKNAGSTGGGLTRAFGGPLPGHAPHDRADNVEYRGTPGEWVIQRPTARFYGPKIMQDFNAGRIPKHALQALAYGGEVQRRIDVRTSNNRPPDVAATYRTALAYAEAAGDRQARTIAAKLAKAYIKKAQAAAASAGGAPGAGSGAAAGPGMSGIIRAARSHGIRSIGTYPGHHPSMARARDLMTSNKALGDRLASHLWRNRKAYNLWYLVWWRRIISMTRPGAGWRPYNVPGQPPHTDHIHAAVYDKGGRLRHGRAALNFSGQTERVLTGRQNYNFERLVRAVDRSGGGNTTIQLTLSAPNYFGPVAELEKVLVASARQGRLKTALREAGVKVG